MTTGVARAGSSATPLIAGGIIFAPLVGVVLALDLPTGLALVAVLCYLPLALLNLPLAVVLWIPLVFLGALPAFNAAGKAAGVLLVVAWLGTLGNRQRAAAAARIVDRHRRLIEVLVLLLVWLALSVVWAPRTDLFLADIWHWIALALLWVILATTLDTPRALRLAGAAFIAGAVFSVMYGWFSGSLTSSETELRLEGAGGDPNFLAASLVAAIVLACSLLGSFREPLARIGLAAAIPVLAAGLVTSQSRGGMLAALGTIVVALVAFKRRRGYVAAFALLAVGMALVSFAVTPQAWERITSLDSEGSGRSSLWTVAVRVIEDHPIAGVGLNNFVAVSADYVREPGALSRVRRIAEAPQFVHNMYLHLLAENGVIGFALYMLFVAGCLRAAWLAARRFAALGDPTMETFARAVLVAGISMLISAFFLSSMVDQRMWVLFSLGPALLAAAHGRAPAAAQAPAATRSKIAS
jgi:O-antigen ligase